MIDNFDTCMNFVLEQEGGYINNPADPGGMTNLGVTKRVWEEWTGHEVDEKQMRSLVKADVVPLYQRKFWNACRCNELPAGIDLCVFDTAVNSGPGRAVKILQSCLGVPTDGAIGSVTVAAANQFKDSALIHLIEDYCSARQAYLISLPTFGTFGKGWTARVNRLKEAATKLLG
jgi:lysozyme family protein